MGIGVPEEWVNVWAMFVGGKKMEGKENGCGMNVCEIHNNCYVWDVC